MISTTPFVLILLGSAARALAVGNCTVNSGQSGICISTADCASSKGEAEAGHCAGAASIQCCTYSTCTANGQAGLCQPTSTCEGTSTPGLCNGGNSIQCCTASAGSGDGDGDGDGDECGPRHVNQATLDLVEEFEGWGNSPYGDLGGNPTIGYGHLCSSSSCSEIGYAIPLSRADGQALLRQDLQAKERCISQQVSDSVTLNPNQYGALVSWAFNMGCGSSGSSTLIGRLNKGEDPDSVAGEELPKWVYTDGAKVDGLVRRRRAEVDLFTTAASGTAHPPTC